MVEPTHVENMLVKLDRFPGDWGENEKCLKPISTKSLPTYALLNRAPVVFLRTLPPVELKQGAAADVLQVPLYWSTDKLKRVGRNCEPLLDNDRPEIKHQDGHNTENL